MGVNMGVNIGVNMGLNISLSVKKQVKDLLDCKIANRYRQTSMSSLLSSLNIVFGQPCPSSSWGYGSY
jgi:hypothetical protein